MSGLQDLTESGVLSRWQCSMEVFVKDAFGVEQVTDQQKRACQEVTALVLAKIKVGKQLPGITKKDIQYSRKLGISIQSGQGTGKTAWLSWFIWWFIVCFPKPRLAASASSGTQLKINLWSDLAKWRNDSRLKDLIKWESRRVFLTELEGQESFCEARTFNVRQGAEEQAETLAGLHEIFMSYVLDEASGIPDPVFKPVEGGMTGMVNFAILAFNPTRSSGFAIETQRRYRDDWICLHWSSEDSPLVPKHVIARDLKRHGRDSNFYRIRRLGLAPVAEKGALIPWEWIINAVDRPLEPTPDDPTVMALDVGAGGDDSALSRSCGPVIYPFETTSTSDSNILTGWALRHLFEHDPRFVFVDVIGYGWAVAGNLRARYTNGEVIEVNVNTEAREKDKFKRLRDELWWRVREEFESGIISIPDDAILIEELSAFHYEEDHQGLVKVESKDDLAARGFDSPNRADTIMMRLFYDIADVRRMKSPEKRDRSRESEVSWRTV